MTRCTNCGDVPRIVRDGVPWCLSCWQARRPEDRSQMTLAAHDGGARPEDRDA